MAEIILITGGARSGKSGHAQALAEGCPGDRLYIATSPSLDEEMRRRIERHRADRQGRGWQTVEAQLDLAGAMRANPKAEVVLVDCLTLWLSNLLFEADEPEYLSEDMLAARAREIVAAARERSGVVILVTNEVGCGIVPDNPLARRFRDLAGRCSQTIAAEADRVDLVTCGIVQTIKG